MTPLPRIIKATPTSNFHLHIVFDNNVEKTIDIKPFIKNGVSSKLKEESYFEKVQVENGYITWENGFDFCPEFLLKHT